VAIEFEGIFDRLRKVVSAGPSGVSGAWLTPGGKTWIFVAAPNAVEGPQVWARPAEPEPGGRLTQLTTAPGAKYGLQLTADGRKIYYLTTGGRVQVLDLATRATAPVPLSATVETDAAKENEQLFAEAWWVMDRFFYDPAFHGRDWAKTRAKYAALLPHVTARADLYDLLSEMIQELNASHLGVTPPGEPEEGEGEALSRASTAALGFEPDWKELDATGRIRVGAVTPLSPAGQKASRLNVGEYLLAVDGEELGKNRTLSQMLEGKAGRKVVLLVNIVPSKQGAREVAIKPISQSALGELVYQAWVKSRRALVEQLSGGKLGYVHIRAMNEPSLNQFKRELTTRAGDKQGLVIDVRYNPGGSTAHELLGLLQKKPFALRRARGGDVWISDSLERGYALEKPSVLLINQRSASNAEMFAEGFKTLGIGPVVGVSTPGAVIGTSVWTLMDGGSIRIPFNAVYTAAGENFERKGRQPDFPVPYAPSAAWQGRDPQLEKAVQVLLPRANDIRNTAFPGPGEASAGAGKGGGGG
jgi:tricorn protease